MVHKSGQHSANSIAEELQSTIGINIRTKTVSGSYGQAAAASLTSSTRPSAGWSGVKHTATGLWSSGNTFCGVTNHTSFFFWQSDGFGFSGYTHELGLQND